MAKQFQHRRGTTAQHNAFTGVPGEITVDTTKNTAVVHDGVTVGGHPLALAGDSYTKAQSDATIANYTPTAQSVTKDTATGVAYLPAGTTAQRPTLAVGVRAIRFNTDLNSFEGWDGTTWGSLGGGATGGGSDHVFNNNDYLITTSYTIPSGKSSVSVGDSNGNISMNSGAVVTLNTGSRWVIL